MKRVLARFGWVRSTVAALTLAGVAVVFLVVILPTAFGSSKASKKTCKIRFKSFSTDKAFLTQDDPGEKGAVAIFGSNLHSVDQVQFGGSAGKQWITAASVLSMTVAATCWPRRNSSRWVYPGGSGSSTTVRIRTATQSAPLSSPQQAPRTNRPRSRSSGRRLRFSAGRRPGDSLGVKGRIRIIDGDCIR